MVTPAFWDYHENIDRPPVRDGSRGCAERTPVYVKAGLPDPDVELTARLRRLRDVLADRRGYARVLDQRGWMVNADALAVLIGDRRRSVAANVRSIRQGLAVLCALGIADRRRFGKTYAYRLKHWSSRWVAVPIGDLYNGATDDGCYVLLCILQDALDREVRYESIRQIAVAAGLGFGTVREHLAHLGEAGMLDGYKLAESLMCNAPRVGVDAERFRRGKPLDDSSRGRRRQARRAR